MDETIADAKITEIQQTLAKLGYYTYEVTGYYGEATTAAVKDFQAKAGIEKDVYRTTSFFCCHGSSYFCNL